MMSFRWVKIPQQARLGNARVLSIIEAYYVTDALMKITMGRPGVRLIAFIRAQTGETAMRNTVRLCVVSILIPIWESFASSLSLTTTKTISNALHMRALVLPGVRLIEFIKAADGEIVNR